MKTTLEKILLAIIVAISIYAIVTTFEKRRFESKYNSELEKDTKAISDTITALRLKLEGLTLKHQTLTESIQNESENTNDKLKQDEKNIDDSVISKRERDSILASYER